MKTLIYLFLFTLFMSIAGCVNDNDVIEEVTNIECSFDLDIERIKVVDNLSRSFAKVFIEQIKTNNNFNTQEEVLKFANNTFTTFQERISKDYIVSQLTLVI